MKREELLRAAREVRGRAHAPYSGYAVGAAVETEDGRIFRGCNVENASYGLTLCAERSAVAAAVAAGASGLRAIAVVTRDGGSPCGACRQVLREFAVEAAVLLEDEEGKVRETTLTALLPQAFGPENLSQ